MNLKKTVVLPQFKDKMEILGENIKLARLRRKLTAMQVSERAGVSRSTLNLIEKGDVGVSMGNYFNVLRTLGLQEDLFKVAEDDVFGRKLQDLDLLNKNNKLISLQVEARKIYSKIYFGIKKGNYNKDLEKIVGLSCEKLIKHLNNNKYSFTTTDRFIDIDHIIPIKDINKLKDIETINHFSNLQLLPEEYNRDIKRDNPWNVEDFERWLSEI